MKKKAAHTCTNKKKVHLKIEKCSKFSNFSTNLRFFHLRIGDTIFFIKQYHFRIKWRILLILYFFVSHVYWIRCTLIIKIQMNKTFCFPDFTHSWVFIESHFFTWKIFNLFLQKKIVFTIKLSCIKIYVILLLFVSPRSN